MSEQQRVAHAELGELLARLQLGVDPSELHGSLCGYLCGGGHSNTRRWLEDIGLDEPEALQAMNNEDRELLNRLFEQTQLDLRDPELGFEPLLAADDEAMDLRCALLSEWCRGFLGGLGIAGLGVGDGLSEDGNEVMEDIYRIGATELVLDEEGPEEDESAFMEILEYVRMGVLLIFSELRRGTSPPRVH